MAHDSSYLRRATGVDGFRYHEIAEDEEHAAAASRWPLLALVNRTLVIAQRARALSEPPVAQLVHPVAMSEAG